MLSGFPKSQRGSEGVRGRAECTVVSTAVWVCISLTADGTEHLSMCLLIIYVSLLEKRLFESFAHFLIG